MRTTSIVVLCALIALFAGWRLSSLLPEEWVSETVVRLAPGYVEQTHDAGAPFRELARPALSDASLTSIIKTHNLYPELSAEPPTRVARRMRDAISIHRTTVDGQPAYRLVFRYPVRLAAMNALQDVISSLRANAGLLRRDQLVVIPTALSDTFDPELVQILDLPTLPDAPSRRNQIEASVTGLAFGLLLGAALIDLRRRHRLSY